MVNFVDTCNKIVSVGNTEIVGFLDGLEQKSLLGFLACGSSKEEETIEQARLRIRRGDVCLFFKLIVE